MSLRQSSRLKLNHELETKAPASNSIPLQVPTPPRARKNAQAPVQTVALPPSPSRRRKKQKIATDKPREDDFRKIKGRRGQLKLMTEMPVDVLLEIFSHVQPLHLSRATKALRVIITGTNGKLLWKQAYENIAALEPPSCPEGVNPMLYTSLLFGRNCQACGSTQGEIIHWASRARFCSKCAPAQLLYKYGRPAPAYVDNEILTFCVVSNMAKYRKFSGGHFILKAEYHHHSQELQKIKGGKAKLNYRREATSRKEKRQQEGHVLSSWYERYTLDQIQEVKRIRNKRYNDIVARVKEEGYGPELADYPLDAKLPAVRIVAELTDKGWDRIKGNLLETMEFRRQSKLWYHIENILRDRLRYMEETVIRDSYKTLKKPYIVAHSSNLARREPFQSLIRDTPIDQKINPAHLTELAVHIPEMNKLWRAEADTFLLGLLSEPSRLGPGGEVDRTPLERATTFFNCYHCSEPITYPRILMHDCLRNRLNNSDPYAAATEELLETKAEQEEADEEPGDAHSETKADKAAQTAKYDMPEATPTNVWNKMSFYFGSDWNEGSDQISVDDEASGFARVIVKACGEDPDTTSFERMQELDARVECVRCSEKMKNKLRSRLVMNWTTAILHDIEVHYEEKPAKNGWKLLSAEEDIAKVQAYEAKMSTKWKAREYVCRYCNNSMSIRDLKSHLNKIHKHRHSGDLSANPDRLNRHAYMPMDISIKMAPYPVKI